jgi:predicted transcriptional regulator
VSVKDVPVVNAGIDFAVCEGIGANLSATGATTYVWSTGQQGNTITVTPAATTTYAVVGTTNGCSAADTITVTVKTAPKPTITPSSSICAGQKVTLVAGGGDSYVWSTGSNGSSIDVQPTQTSVYAVTVTNLEGCRAVAQTVVTVIAAPIVSLSPNITLCKGGNATLQAGGGTTFSWSTGEKTAAIVVAPNVSSLYTVTVSNAAGCTAEKSVLVSVIDAVVANAGKDQSICQGASATLTAEGGTDYLWNSGQSIKTITVNPSVTTSYVVTVSNGNCVGKDTVTVTVNALPKADAGSDQTICQGSAANLTATGGLTYVWSSGQTSETITVSPASTTTYLVTVTNKEGCSATDVVIVQVNPLPNADITGNKQICVGDSLALQVNQTPNFLYFWSNGAAGSKIIVAPNKTTAYTVTVTDFLGCKNQSTVQVIVNSLPVVDLGQDTIKVQLGSNAKLDAGSGQSAYVWSNGATSSTLVVSDPSATYCVTVTNQFGCKANDCIFVKFVPLGVNELQNWHVNVFPNPTLEYLNIQATELFTDMQVMIYAASGQLVERVKMKDLQMVVDVSHYASGTYLIKFVSAKGVKETIFMKH